MRILMHCCCGPCALYPLSVLRDQGHEVVGLFHNPNIHPFREFRRRLRTFRDMARARDMECLVDDDYGLVPYLRRVVMYEEHRCTICYAMRLRETARRAADLGFDAWTTTLLYSRHQRHATIRERAEQTAERAGVPFHYQDFRKGWQQGIDESLELDLYRQPYCGCIYSEQERYDKKLRRRLRKQAADAAGSGT